MLFKRPKDLRIVDMCQIVDKLIQQDEWTEKEKDDIVRYLYFIIYSISKKKNYFHNVNDCDDFSIYFAEQLYYRFTSRDRGLDKIVSCLNYIKPILYGRILNWQQNDKFIELLEDCNSTEKYNLGHYIDPIAYKEQIKDEIDYNGRDVLIKSIKSEIESLPKLVKKVCSLTQFKNDKVITNNLHISVLLSLLNGITLVSKLEENIKQKRENNTLRDNYLIENRLKNINDSIILWHLDDTYKDIVKVLINRVKVMFSESLHNIGRNWEVTPEILDAMISIGGGEFRGNTSE